MKIMSPLACLILAATPASADSLLGAWAAAKSHDPGFLGAIDTLAADSEAKTQARSLFLPQVRVQGGVESSRSQTNFDLPAAYQSLVPGTTKGQKSSVEVAVSQAIYDMSAVAQAKQLNEKARAAKTHFSAEEQNLMLRVTEAWCNLLAADDDLRVIRAQKAVTLTELKNANARFTLGKARVTDIRESQSQFDQTSAAEITAIARRQIAAAQFRELTGLDNIGTYSFSETFAPAPPLEALADWQARAEKQDPKVIDAEHRLNSARASINQYSWAGRPTVYAVAGYSGSWFDGTQGQLLSPRAAEAYSIGARLSVPLETGGYYPSKLREASAEVRKAEHDLDGSRRDARLEVQQAWLGVASGVEQINALRTALASARLQEKAAITGRELGSRTQTDVLAAQTQVFSTLRQLNSFSYDYEKNRARLAAKSGDLNEAVLTGIDADFQKF